MKKITFLLLFAMVCSFSFAQTFPGTGTPVDTQNGQTGTSATCGTAFELNLTVDVTGIGVLGAALVLDQIDLDITHTFSGDIVVTLIAPDGTTLIDVTSGNGGGGDNYVGTQFRDDATTPITAGAAPFTGIFIPEQALSTFNGLDADGTWTLNFCDSAGGDIGTFNSWSINFAPPPPCANPTNLTGVVLTASTVELSWIASGTETLWDLEVVDITGGGSATGTPTVTGVTNPYLGMGLTEGNDYEAYVRADCGVDGTSDWVGPFAWSQNVPPPNDLPAGAIPITPSPEGTGCATAAFTLPFSTDFTTDSGVQGGCSPSGLDQFFSWTATTDGLTFNSADPGSPGMVVWDALTLAEIDCVDTFATDAILGGWTIGQDLVIQIYDFDGSLSDVAFCLEEYTLPALPNCTETPIFPADGAVDALITFTLTWTAPTTGPAPTDYQGFFGVISGALVDQGNLGSTDTFATVNGLEYSTTYYWRIVPLNGASAATGCAEWSFTTEAAPPPPANDNLCSAQPIAIDTPGTSSDYTTASATAEVSEPVAACFNGGINGSVWFSFEAPASGEVEVSTDYTGGTLIDTEIAVYDATGVNCADLSTLSAELGCDQDGGVDEQFNSVLNLTALTPGSTYFVQVDRWGTANDGTFGIQVFDEVTLSTETFDNEAAFTYFPNPVKNTLTLNAQNIIEQVAMYNMLGQEVLRATPNTVNSDLDMSNLQTGTYFVKVTIGNVTKTIRVMKQ